jgi:hypothetical protein
VCCLTCLLLLQHTLVDSKKNNGHGWTCHVAASAVAAFACMNINRVGCWGGGGGEVQAMTLTAAR